MVLVRPADPAEYAAIGELTVAAYRADGQFVDDNPYEHALRDVAGRARHNEVLVAVDEERDAILGAVTFVLPGSDLAELSRPGEAEFRMLAVDPAAHGRGVGQALVRACLARAPAHGCSAVVICTRDFAKPAQRLYERMGFVRVPELDWSPMPDVSLLGLRLRLPAPAEPAAAAPPTLPAEPAQRSQSAQCSQSAQRPQSAQPSPAGPLTSSSAT